jgi:hypothetical protein
LVCGSNIEDHLSSENKFDDVEDEYNDEDDVVALYENIIKLEIYESSYFQVIKIFFYV